MGGKIIDSRRYKKVSRSKLKKNNSKKDYKLKYKKQKLSTSSVPTNLISKKQRFDNLKDNTLKEEKKENFKRNIKTSNFVKIGICVVAIITVALISKMIFSFNNINILSVFSNNEEKREGLVDNYSFNIGISKLDNIDYNKSSNIILNELVSKSTLSLIKMNKDYKIEYKLAEKIEDISDTCYLVNLNPIYKATSDDVINSYNNIKSLGQSNIYYPKVLNINKIEKVDNTSFKVYFNTKNPFGIYSLDFPITSTLDKSPEYNISNKDSNSLALVKNNSKSTLGTIKLTSFIDTDDMVSSFREGNIDMFTASSDNVMQLIGKREYNVKKYRDGETIFLLGNKDSSLFKRKEIRQALAYSINRDEIVKNVDMKFSEVIDIPFIYSSVKYKYDLYAAENTLLLSGWKKTGGIYNKNDGYEYKKIELNLLVNKDDNTKSLVADSIKEMVEKVGIKINVLKLSEKEINDKVSKGEYDLVLSTLSINENPNIEYLYNYINVDDITNSAIENVKTSNVSNIEENVNNLKETISSEVACIGILAKTTNVVYQKYITGFDNILYMKIFDNLENIGKIDN